jgi:predicted metal-dependent HD superfamily phosphohydrolase
LAELDRCAPGDSSIEGAIWFHDVVYDPTRHDNEDASVAWFTDNTGSWLEPNAGECIRRLIEATDFRRPRGEDPAAALMVDIDLAILSADAAIYQAYTRAIRQEYGHVPDGAFRAGRKKVMEHFLAGPIYRTAAFLPREERARGNILREVERLSA